MAGASRSGDGGTSPSPIKHRRLGLFRRLFSSSSSSHTRSSNNTTPTTTTPQMAQPSTLPMTRGAALGNSDSSVPFSSTPKTSSAGILHVTDKLQATDKQLSPAPSGNLNTRTPTDLGVTVPDSPLMPVKEQHVESSTNAQLPTPKGSINESKSGLSLTILEDVDMLDPLTPSKAMGDTSGGSNSSGQPTAEISGAFATPDDEESPRTQAQKLFEGVSKIPHWQGAAWLGAAERADVRKEYMSLFDWTGLSVLASLRGLCSKLYMKAESQHLDRILDSFSDHWCDCNPNHGFKSAGIVYALAYSILLLNTDLHSEEYSGSKKMPRAQYVQQTLETVRSLLKAEAAEARTQQDNGPVASSAASRRSNSFDSQRPSLSNKRWSANFSAQRTDNTTLVMDPIPYSAKEWDNIMSGLLKSIYSSIDLYPLALSKVGDHDRFGSSELFTRSSLDLRGPPTNSIFLHPQSSAASLSGPYASRNNSLLSKLSLNRRSSYNDSWSDYEYQGIIAQNPGAPYLGKRRSMYGSQMSPMTPTETVGFAGALRNSIIREEHAAHFTANSDMMSIADSVNSLQMADSASITTSIAGSMMPETIQEEELELSGPPWAKEGLLKMQLGADTSRKYKKKDTWVQVFVVVGKGYLKVFRFDAGAGHKRSHRGHSSLQPRSSVSDLGGGNWLDQAVMTDNVSLAHTLAQIIPGKNQGSVANNDSPEWSLNIPGDRVLVFRAGTDEIASEYVYSCNYWAARVSKEPLVEAVSSSEYGWNRPLELVGDKTKADATYKPKITASSFDSIVVEGMRIQIKEWRPRVPSTVHSCLDEEMQLDSLRRHVANVERVLLEHNGYRRLMIDIFQPGHVVSTRAHSNWEKRSQYLLRETVIYETYIQMLERAMKDRDSVNSAKEAEQQSISPTISSPRHPGYNSLNN